MEQILYKSKVSPLYISLGVGGAIFSGCFSYMLLTLPWHNLNGTDEAIGTIIVWIFAGGFVAFASVCILMLVTMRSFVLTNKALIIKQPILLQKRRVELVDIEAIEEGKLLINSSHDFRDFNVYRGKQTYIKHSNGKDVKITSFEIRNYHSFIAYVQNERRRFKWRLDDDKLRKLDRSWNGYGRLAFLLLMAGALLYSLLNQ